MNAKDAIRQVIEWSHMLTQVVRGRPERRRPAGPLGAGHEPHRLATGARGRRNADDARGVGVRRRRRCPTASTRPTRRETAASDDPAKFRKKAEYLALMDQMKAASLAAVDATPEADLDKPGPEMMREYAPTVAAMLMVLGTHWLMHAGQFVPIRRKLGKPPLF